MRNIKGISFIACCLTIALLAFVFSSCSSSRQTTQIEYKKFGPDQLRKDYRMFRGALEESHPSLYWFTPRDSMDRIFDQYYLSIKDSMTERQFKTMLTAVITNIRCGHTAINYSKEYSRYLDTADLKIFPLSFKVWKDTLAITANLNRQDSILKRGMVVTAINGYPAEQLIDTFFNYTTGDGYSGTGKYQSLSSWGTFGVTYKNVFGLTDSFHIHYVNEFGSTGETTIPVFVPRPDTLDTSDTLLPEKYTPRERRNLRSFSTRNLQVDTTLHSAYMTLNTFSRGNGLRKFFRSSFKSIKRLNLQHLVVDVRSNGGGDAGISTFLTEYLIDHRFKIADSLYAIKRSTRYRRHVPLQPIYWLMMTAVTRKRADGKFHFGYFERHYFKPRKRNHFDGNIYILTGGNSFSATTLFAQQLKGQHNVILIGEETGGGGYGNTAWVIPELKLPITKLRVGLPKFRMVMRKDLVKEGRGVMPDIYVAPTAADIKNGIDVKEEKVRQIIMQANGFIH